MIVFNELRISDDGKYMYIDAEVENLSYYKYIYLTALNIDTDETYTSTGISSHPVYTNTEIFDPENADASAYTECVSNPEDYKDTSALYKRRITLRLSAKDLGLEDLNHNIFFVYLSVGGVLNGEKVPCCYDVSYECAVVYNLKTLYDTGLRFLKHMTDRCTIDKEFIDYILRINAFKLAIDSGNFDQAKYYWKMFLGGPEIAGIGGTISDCGCHGVI